MYTCRAGSEKMYSFSEFTCSLNELEEGMAPTDCHFRPDRRFMEQQDFDKANEEKVCNVHELAVLACY